MITTQYANTGYRKISFQISVHMLQTNAW